MKAVALILLAVRGPSFFRPEAATPPVISYSLRRAGFCSISAFPSGLDATQRRSRMKETLYDDQ